MLITPQQVKSWRRTNLPAVDYAPDALVLEYIRDNPACTLLDIEGAMYPNAKVQSKDYQHRVHTHTIQQVWKFSRDGLVFRDHKPIKGRHCHYWRYNL